MVTALFVVPAVAVIPFPAVVLVLRLLTFIPRCSRNGYRVGPADMNAFQPKEAI
jgi:hypothetical protein